MDEWIIGVSPWIINDGNYSEIFLSQVINFGIELYLEGVQPSDSNIKIAKPLGGENYEFVGEVVYVANNFLILDFGVMGYSKFKTLPEYAKLGQFIKGKVKILLDPFFIKEISHIHPVYSWKINQIIEVFTPVVFNKSSKGVDVGSYVYSQTKQKIVTKTDALHAKIGISYLLYCTKLHIISKTP